MRDIKGLDLNLLKALDALLDERSVTRAADKLGLTQPAVSGMLNRLRESFDDPLFVRTQRGILPTVRATELAGPVKKVLGDVEGLLQPTVFDPKSAEFTVSIAATDYALHAVVLPFVPRLRALAPGIRLAVRPIEEQQIQNQFEKGILDLALMTPESSPLDLHSRHLFDETYVCTLRASHPGAAAGAMDVDQFCELDHALVSYAGDRFWGVTDDALAAVGKKRRVVLSVTSFLILAQVLRNTDLIAVVPSRLVRGTAELTAIEPPVAIPGFTKIAAWHERTHHDPGHRWVRALLFETFNRSEEIA